MRISGPAAGRALIALSGRSLPKPRRAALRRLFDARGAPLDDALALWFPAPASFTGEDVAELHLHGGLAVIAAVADALAALPGLRLARSGEFTRRAFENGKLDLTEAEGLADLIDAETEGQRLQALRQMEGALGRLYEDWRARLTQALALLEAAIDFPDEDLPDDLARRVEPLLTPLAGELAAHLNDNHRGERVRDGYRIAIIGAPNAGKSSLLNALAQREAAIVSDIPGTTRDVVEVRLVLGGFPVWIADTAGLRDAADVIEAEGVKRALTRAEEADLRLGVVDGADAAGSRAALAGALRADDFTVITKRDTHAESCKGAQVFCVSSVNGAGIAELEGAIAARVQRDLSGIEVAPLTRARHREHLAEALSAIERACVALSRAPELAAEDLRAAGQSLARITGRFDVELILDAIFSQFCIGK
jgi:tRNA modification GTPase